jgi:hypothetical protein
MSNCQSSIHKPWMIDNLTWMFVWFVHTHVHTQTHTRTPLTHSLSQTPYTCVRTLHKQTHSDTRSHIIIIKPPSTHIYTNIHTRIYTYIYTQTYIHAYTHTYIYCMYTYIQNKQTHSDTETIKTLSHTRTHTKNTQDCPLWSLKKKPVAE